jgi:hypothetical protein
MREEDGSPSLPCFECKTPPIFLVQNSMPENGSVLPPITWKVILGLLERTDNLKLLFGRGAFIIDNRDHGHGGRVN